MPTWASVTMLVLVLALAGWGMWYGWRERTRRSAVAVPAPPAVPDDLGALLLGPLDGTYVSTTRSGDWLDRVSAHDLGVRSAAQVEVHTGGVLLRRQGARDVLVPGDRLRAVGTAPGMAGKFVGGEGLVVLTWSAGDDASGDLGAQSAAVLLDTGVRLRRKADRARLLESVRTLLADQEGAA